MWAGNALASRSSFVKVLILVVVRLLLKFRDKLLVKFPLVRLKCSYILASSSKWVGKPDYDPRQFWNVVNFVWITGRELFYINFLRHFVALAMIFLFCSCGDALWGVKLCETDTISEKYATYVFPIRGNLQRNALTNSDLIYSLTRLSVSGSPFQSPSISYYYNNLGIKKSPSLFLSLAGTIYFKGIWSNRYGIPPIGSPDQ